MVTAESNGAVLLGERDENGPTASAAQEAGLTVDRERIRADAFCSMPFFLLVLLFLSCVSEHNLPFNPCRH